MIYFTHGIHGRTQYALGSSEGLDTAALAVGKRYTVVKGRERAFPFHIAILMVDSDWNFYGYCIAHKAVVSGQKSEIEFDVLTLFSADERRIYKEKFLAAAKMTGEVK